MQASGTKVKQVEIRRWLSSVNPKIVQGAGDFDDKSREASFGIAQCVFEYATALGTGKRMFDPNA